MDPCSLIGVASASLTVIATIGSTVKSLSELRSRYAEADQSIRMLITQLSTIKAALSLIHEWVENDLVELHTQAELVMPLNIAIDGCKEAMEALAEEVSDVLGKAIKETAIGFKSRTKYMWNEDTMKEHQSRLESQVMALQFLVTAVQWLVPASQVAIYIG